MHGHEVKFPHYLSELLDAARAAGVAIAHETARVAVPLRIKLESIAFLSTAEGPKLLPGSRTRTHPTRPGSAVQRWTTSFK